MELPENIEKEILDYLHLEYGEDPKHPSSLKLDEIKYDGLYEVSGVPIHYFKYASRSGRNWATVEPYGDSYLIGMTASSPKPLSKTQIYNQLNVESLDNNYTETFELESWGEGCYGFSDYREIELPNGSTFKLLAEVSSYSVPVGVTLSIIEGDNNLYIRGSVGLTLSYESKNLGILSITLGTGPWE
jgi:hypothetical protein